MTLTAHIVGKDLFRLRWILLLWMVLVAAQMTLAEIQGALDQTWGYAFYLMAWVFGGVFLPLTNFGLVLGVQSDDPVSDSDAFWITRPISAGQLLRAKMAALVILWLVPCLALLPWWFAQGFDRGQFGAALLQTFAWQAVFTLAALPFALISRNATRFLMNVILAAGGAFVLAQLPTLFRLGSDLSLLPGAPGRWTWAVAAIWLAATVAISLIQFLTRRTRQSIALLLLAVTACATIAGWWPPSFAAASAAGPTPEAAVPAFRFASARLKDGVVQARYEEPAGGEHGRLLLVRDAVHRLAWPEDVLSIHSTPAVAAQFARAGAALALGNSGAAEFPIDLALPEEARRLRLLADPPRATAALRGNVMALTVEATLRPKAGEVARGEGRRLRVIDVVPNDPARGVVITVGESMADPDAGGWRNLGGPPAPPPVVESYFLVQREQGRAVAGVIRPAGPELTAGGIHHLRRELLFSLNEEEFKRWGEGATLVQVVAREAGAFSTVVETPRFEIEAEGRSAAAPPAL